MPGIQEGEVRVDDTAIAQEAIERVKAVARADKPALDRLGITLDAVEAGRVTLGLVVEPSMANSHGTCHGGFVFALADTAFAYALLSVGKKAATVQASICLIRPARLGSKIHAIAEVSKAGRSISFATCRIFDSENVLIAEFQGNAVNG